ncbi:DUF2493 domain-containing protein [[Pseudomonas] carboxydohydrogena]|uniref:DUF2493 domain-containing protein n=1 Tax=Afipia carboxydohydrogena TaxID=290 RepID=A0ABY8BVT2_AFICR|nr:SLOG family protein [[Pseudomonas] carboxydohydrogena]WEF52527.1 DUF2493 domain-containing protein [[Pseudomonas] carboxydohydrogena]
MTTIIVCGGRWYGRVPLDCTPELRQAHAARAAKQAFFMRETLDHLRRDRGVRKVISGGAPGADTIAHQWAISKTIASVVMRAEWKKFGRAAEPIRNKRMLEEGKPDFVIAFFGGDGTADMIQQARFAGVEVIDYRERCP